MTEEKKPFTVNDRRHFTPEGSVRDEAPSSEQRQVAPSDVGPAAKVGSAAEHEGPVGFASFLFSLGGQAASLLAGATEGDERPRRLSEARALISILEMLKDKTRGNRTEDEEDVIEGLLYELRMTYVSAARVSGT